MIRLEQYFREKATQELSSDQIVAEVLSEECRDLDWRVKQGQTNNVGFIWIDGTPFIWELTWARQKDSSINFEMKVHQVLPKSLRLKTTRTFTIKEKDL